MLIKDFSHDLLCCVLILHMPIFHISGQWKIREWWTKGIFCNLHCVRCSILLSFLCCQLNSLRKLCNTDLWYKYGSFPSCLNVSASAWSQSRNVLRWLNVPALAWSRESLFVQGQIIWLFLVFQSSTPIICFSSSVYMFQLIKYYRVILYGQIICFSLSYVIGLDYMV